MAERWSNPLHVIADLLKAKRIFEAPPEPYVRLGQDSTGKRYTSHAFAGDRDPRRGAIILSPRIIDGLKERGEWPLKPVHGADMSTAWPGDTDAEIQCLCGEASVKTHRHLIGEDRG